MIEELERLLREQTKNITWLVQVEKEYESYVRIKVTATYQTVTAKSRINIGKEEKNLSFSADLVIYDIFDKLAEETWRS